MISSAYTLAATEVTMAEVTHMAEGWTRNERPPHLYRRFEFRNYAETGAFLDRLAALSKETGCYPDISFGKVYANVTVHASDGTRIGAQDLEFASRISELAAVADEGE